MIEYLGKRVTVIEERPRTFLQRRRRRRIGFWLILPAVLLAAWWLWNSWRCGCVAPLIGSAGAQTTSTSRPPAQLAGVAHVIDGDTIYVGTWRVRLFGIDAPEVNQTCSRGQEPVECGHSALAALKAVAQNRMVDCVRRSTDRYGRMVAVCRTAEGSDLGRLMVESGWAIAFRRYSLDYVGAEGTARAAGRGLWSGTFDLPEDWRREHAR